MFARHPIRRSCARRRRRGTAVPELAICLPVLFVIIFGSIEITNLIFLRQTLVEASYEGALLGSQKNTTEAEILQRVQATLAARDIEGGSVWVDVTSAANYDALAVGESFSVHVEAPSGLNIPGPTLLTQSILVEVDLVGHKQ